MKHKLMHVVSMLADLVDMQSALIDRLSESNNELIRLLRQYMTLEEIDALDAIKDINKAAAIRECIERKKQEAGCAP